MKKNNLLLTVVMLLILTTISCNLPSLFAGESEIDIEQAVELTLAAASDETGEGQAESDQQTGDSEPLATEAPPTETAPPSETPTVTSTFTPAVPMVSVTNNTNCRTGPGTVYDLLGVLLIGEEAEVVARSSLANYVIIDNPDNPGSDCWLWMQYGQISGSIDNLPVLDPPPTPTPAPTATPEINFSIGVEDIASCAGKDTLFIKITNTGALRIESVQVNAKNQDTSETVAYDSNGFGGSATCISLAVGYIDPGNAAYKGAGFTPSISGEKIDITIKACAEDGLGGACRTKSTSYDVPMPSNVNTKENFQSIDSQQILAQVAELPITSWNYINPERPGTHIGPMAQDFYAAFGLGQSTEYIHAVDAYGVSLAAIQALDEINQAQSRQIELLIAQNEELIQQNANLEKRLEKLETESYNETVIAVAIGLAGVLIALAIVVVFSIFRKVALRS